MALYPYWRINEDTFCYIPHNFKFGIVLFHAMKFALLLTLCLKKLPRWKKILSMRGVSIVAMWLT